MAMKRTGLISVVLVLAACASKPPKAPEKVVQPIDQKWLEETAAEHNHDVMNCYIARLKSKPGVQGELHLEFNVSPAGEMKDLKVTKSADIEVDKCVFAAAKAWKFPWNVRGSSFDQAMADQFKLYLEDGQPRTTFEERQIGMDKDAVRKVVQEHLKDVNGCYESRLRTSPGLVGKVVLDWEIWNNGFAHDIRVKKSLDATLDNCLVDKVKTWQFPIPPKGLTGRVDFPFTFATE
jgi:hypothetical protein